MIVVSLFPKVCKYTCTGTRPLTFWHDTDIWVSIKAVPPVVGFPVVIFDLQGLATLIAVVV